MGSDKLFEVGEREEGEVSNTVFLSKDKTVILMFY